MVFLHSDKPPSSNKAKKLKITPLLDSKHLKCFAKIFLGEDKSTTRNYFIENEELILAVCGGKKFDGKGRLCVEAFQNDFRGDLEYFEFATKSIVKEFLFLFRTQSPHFAGKLFLLNKILTF